MGESSIHRRPQPPIRTPNVIEGPPGPAGPTGPAGSAELLVSVDGGTAEGPQQQLNFVTDAPVGYTVNDNGSEIDVTISIASATTSAEGVVELATDGESVAGLAVQADDSRLSDARDPNAHASSHENGGSDEIDVTGLAGLLADKQDPLAHASTHVQGGSDELDVTNLSGVLADQQNAIPADGIDTSAIHDDVPAEISSISAKAVPTSSDFLLIEDAADSNNKKRITIGDLPGGSTPSLAAVLAAGNTSGGTDIDASADSVFANAVHTNTLYVAGGVSGDNPQVDGITVGDGSGNTEIGQFIDGAGIGYFSVYDTSNTRLAELQYAASNNTWSIVANGAARLQITGAIVQPGSDGGVILGNTLSKGFSGLALTERADHPNTPTPSRCELWLKDGTHQTLILTDDEGNDHALNKWDIHLPANTSEEPSSSAATLQTGMNSLGDLTYIEYPVSGYRDRLWQLRLPRNYAGGDLTLTIYYFGAASNAGANDVIFYGSFLRFVAGDAMGTPGFASSQSVTTAPNATAQKLVIATITFTSAQIDGATAGDAIALRLSRNPGVGADNYGNSVGVFNCTLTESA